MTETPSSPTAATIGPGAAVPADPGIAWDASSWGVDWHLELARRLLLPGRLVDGTVRLTANHAIEARALVVALHAREHWRHEVVEMNAQGQPTTRIVTTTEDTTREPVQVAAPLSLAAGETRTLQFQLPVPELGPASLVADDAGLDWTLEAKLDLDDQPDSGFEQPVVVAQPTALLRAGVIDLPAMALFETAAAASDDITASIDLEPMPLALGSPFTLRVDLTVPASLRLQEIRAELRIRIEATVSGGQHQEVVAWAGQISPPVELTGRHTFRVDATLPDTPLPTVELPHGRSTATLQVILARAWATDTHLTRDVAVAGTAQI